MANEGQGSVLESPVSVTKLQEQATGKAELSYSWWANHTAMQSGPAPDPAPRKLTEEEAQQMERQKSAQGASAWNHAGTFEEKSVGEWGRQWIKSNFMGLRQGSLQISEVTSVTGDANIWFVRGKRRHGFDFALQLSWKSSIGSDPTSEVSGTIMVPNACFDDIDELHLDVSVTNKCAEKAAEEAAAVKEATKMTLLFQAKLKEFYAELKQKV